jgi:hypothetical protein
VSDETLAATIRRAAALMRERAEAAPRGPWRTGAGVGGTGYPKLILNEDEVFAAAEWTMARSWPAAGDYIASMHPLVALAVASWLEIEAEIVRRALPDDSGSIHPALRVARAYLGDTAGLSLAENPGQQQGGTPS